MYMAIIPSKTCNRKDGGKVLIRVAQKCDAQRLLDMAFEVMSERDFTLTEPNELNLTVQQEEEWIQNHSDEDLKIILVAEIAGELIR
jgi:hypothetical protein